MLSPRTRKAVVPFAALVLGAALAIALRRFGHVHPAILSAVGVAVAIAALAFAVACWRALDEVARDAHKTAWYWGGSFGMLVGFLSFVFLDRLHPDLLAGLYAGRDPADLVQAGVIGVILAQIVGYLVVWAGWWIVRR